MAFLQEHDLVFSEPLMAVDGVYIEKHQSKQVGEFYLGVTIAQFIECVP